MDESRTQTEPAPPVPPERPLWRSKSLLVAVAAMVLGFGLWTHDAFERGTIGGGRSLSSSSLATNRPAADSGVKSSALFRFGFSYAGGFLIGWLFRKSLKLALLAAGAVALAVAAGKYFGLFNLDWAAIEAHTAQSLAWLKGELGALKDFLTGYLPSAIVGFLGLLKGARHR